MSQFPHDPEGATLQSVSDVLKKLPAKVMTFVGHVAYDVIVDLIASLCLRVFARLLAGSIVAWILLP